MPKLTKEILLGKLRLSLYRMHHSEAEQEAFSNEFRDFLASFDDKSVTLTVLDMDNLCLYKFPTPVVRMLLEEKSIVFPAGQDYPFLLNAMRDPMIIVPVERLRLLLDAGYCFPDYLHNLGELLDFYTRGLLHSKNVSELVMERFEHSRQGIIR